MKLIICEKPNLALTVAKAIGFEGQEKTDGYMKCRDNTIVTFAYGHLISLLQLKDYQENLGKKWNEYKLPFIPQPFKTEVKRNDKGATDTGALKQLNIIKELSKSAEVIIHCGDADREGQVIIDNIIKEIEYTGKVLRLWLPEQTEESIRSALSQMKDNREYYNLLNEGTARTKIDWLFGMNLTVYLSNKVGQIFPAGRVIVPIVKFVYDRHKEIEEFVPREYFVCESKSGGITLKNKEQFKEKYLAEEKAANLNSYLAKVTNIEKKNIKKTPKKLFSLSTLQSELSKKHKIDFQKSLPIIQSLYDKGYLTYPRTNTEYLSNNEYDKMTRVINELNKLNHKLVNKNTKRIYDDSKIESHSAITPTYKIPDIEKLKSAEQTVYLVVLNRFMANFTEEETIVEERSMYIKVGAEDFVLKGNTIVQDGFYKYEEKEFKDELPNLNIGDEFKVEFETIRKETTAPKLLSESDLSNLLKNPFRKTEIDESEDDSQEYKDILAGIEIGTEATRTGIIGNAINVGYIDKVKNNFTLTQKGKVFIETLDKLNINLYKEKSVELSKMLKEIYKNEKTEQDLLNVVERELNNICNSNIQVERYVEEKESLGACLECESNVIENSKAYTCSNRECKFVIFKEKNFFTFKGAKLTKTMVKSLLKTGKTSPFTMKSKAGQEYKVKGVYKGLNERGYVEFDIEFVNTKKKTTNKNDSDVVAEFNFFKGSNK